MARLDKQLSVATEVVVDEMPQEQPSTDVALGDALGAELAARTAARVVAERGFGPAMTSIVMHIASRAYEDNDLNAVITERLAERLLAATTPEEIVAPFAPDKGEAHYGKALYMEGVTFLESEHEGFPWYVTISCKRPSTGETFAVTVGGERVVTQLAAADMRGLFPLYAVIKQSDKETKSGYRPLSLSPVQ